MDTIFWVLLGIAGLFVLISIVIYNSLVSQRNQVRNAFAQIDVQLKRRNDLIPNLVETVKGYMKHEKTLLENITKARSAMLSANTMEAKAKSSNMISDTLKTLFAVSENYPKLRANENFMQLQEELSGTESKIAFARQFYNDSIMHYNNTIQTFPSNIIAGMFNFQPEKSFEAAAEERKPVKVQF